ncbi:class I SAM-dependent methyltransferase [Paucisalibacillus sp. EB02]|uniref:class I SAM-dependent methyltransferase n=1 Tax=Paucisalibacillus sp. EB02 TaxID=1347087 RepID=UPI0004BC2D2C|nr:class I SAM-dependent methyltransferase [Paucisalibacillus sp. EB02]
MKRTFSTDEAIKRWNLHAESFTARYTKYGDKSRIVALNPTIFSLMGEVNGKQVLDAGCGEGYLSRLLADKGAEVTAVDYSDKMLEIADERTPSEARIHYYYGNCENLDFLEGEQFDMIVSNMVILDLEDYQSALREMYRLLKPGGTFIFSILHPCFITPNSGWIRNDQGEKSSWKVDRYFHEGVYDQRFPFGTGDPIVWYHRTLTSYFKAILRAGFIVEDLVEPKPSKEILRKYPELKEDLNCADFVVFKLGK